jgi:hypothetical protein
MEEFKQKFNDKKGNEIEYELLELKDKNGKVVKKWFAKKDDIL